MKIENFDNFKVKATLKPKKVKKIRSNINIAIEAKDIFQSAGDPFLEEDDVEVCSSSSIVSSDSEPSSFNSSSDQSSWNSESGEEDPNQSGEMS